MNANLRSFHRMPRNAPAVFSAVISIQQSAIGCEPFAPACRIALIGRIEQWASLIIYECWCNGASELQRTAKKGGSIPQRKVSVPCSREFLMPLELSEKYFLDSRVLKRLTEDKQRDDFDRDKGLPVATDIRAVGDLKKDEVVVVCCCHFYFFCFFFCTFRDCFDFAKTSNSRKLFTGVFHCTAGLIRWMRGKLIKIFS